MTGTDAPADPPADSPFRPMLVELFDGRSSVAQPAVSPDGARLAFVVATIDLDENTTATRVWLAGPDGAPAPLTAGPHDDQPVWSPDGRFLAFTSRRGEPGRPGASKEATLHVIPVAAAGEVRTVATMPEGFSTVRWSPDGKWFAFVSRTRDPRYDAKDESWQPPRRIETFFTSLNGEGWTFDRPSHLYVVAADGTGSPRNLTPGAHRYEGVSWLPDSSAVVSAAGTHDTWDRDLVVDLHLVPLDGEHRTITAGTGAYGSPSVSPDGTRVAFVGNDDAIRFPQNAGVGVITLGGGDITWATAALDRTFAPTAGVRAPVWRDDATLLATGEDRGDTHLYELRSDASAPPRALTDGPLAVHGFDAAGGTVALAVAAVEHPAELCTLRDGALSAVTSVTTSRQGWEKFTVPCADGTDEIDAWIMRPVAFDADATYPVLLNVHGGPFTQYGETFFDEAQLQAAAGFVVVMSNPRGGSGREIAWGTAINGPRHPSHPGTGWGSVDVDDIVAVLDHALDAFSFCDRGRVGMLGGSYGGFMATTLAGRFGDRFGAICSERAVNNLITEEFTADISTVWHGTFGVTPLDDPELYAAMSPIRYVRDIDCPVLIIHSEQDLRCPISQAEELFVAMRQLGKDVTFYRFPGENHELTRSGSPVHRVMRAEIVLDFFAARLGASPAGQHGASPVGRPGVSPPR